MNLIPAPTTTTAPTQAAQLQIDARNYRRATIYQTEMATLSENTRRAYGADMRTLTQFTGYHLDAATWPQLDGNVVYAWRDWLMRQGYATATVNRKLSSLKKMARLAHQSEIITSDQLASIESVAGWTGRQAKEQDKQRPKSRISTKKEQATVITPDQARNLKVQHPATPVGARDSLIMTLLIDHALRVGELAAMTVKDIDLQQKIITIYREKTDDAQRHTMTADSYAALCRWLPYQSGDLLLRKTKKGGKLTSAGMSSRAIYDRVNLIGTRIGIDELSPHDGRHNYATDAIRNGTALTTLMNAGSWKSLGSVQRYVQHATIANDGVKLSS